MFLWLEYCKKEIKINLSNKHMVLLLTYIRIYILSNNTKKEQAYSFFLNARICKFSIKVSTKNI